MKTFLVFLFGIGVGALGLYLYLVPPELANGPGAASTKLADSARAAANSAAAKTRDLAGNVSDAIAGKIVAWHLTPEEIKADLAKTGQVVRDNAARTQEKMADVRIIAVIEAKFVLDRGLSVHAIDVASNNGNVTLTGSVPSADLVGKAVAHALDTEGVHHVVARLAVRPDGP
jgi:hyperosmotically inducible periplasmic protein